MSGRLGDWERPKLELERLTLIVRNTLLGSCKQMSIIVQVMPSDTTSRITAELHTGENES